MHNEAACMLLMDGGEGTGRHLSTTCYGAKSQFIVGDTSELSATAERDTRDTPVTCETQSRPAGRAIDWTALLSAAHEMETQTATCAIERASRFLVHSRMHRIDSPRQLDRGAYT